MGILASVTTEETEAIQPNEHPERNVPEPVTTEAIAAIFEEENLEYRVEDQAVRSGFINAAIVIALDGDHLIFEALWRGEFPRDSASQVLFACNEHNQTHFAPTLRSVSYTHLRAHETN